MASTRVQVMTKKLREYNKRLQALSHDTDRIVKFGIYDGIGCFADAIRQELNSDMIVVSDKAAIAAWARKVPVPICDSQRAGLLSGLGIRKMKKKHGAIVTRTHFAGYNSIRTRRWPKGQPNTLIAANCEHGTSHLIEQPFIRPAFNMAQGEALALFRKTFLEESEKVLK